MRHHGAVSVWTIVVAAGEGSRFGGPKQCEPLGNQRVMDHAVDAARTGADGVVVVIPEGADWVWPKTYTTPGAATRSGSVRAGLTLVPDDADVVVVHDAARPLATPALFDAVIAAVRSGADGALPGVAVADTVKEVHNGVVVATLPRDRLVAAQTPQAFSAVALRAAHARMPEGTDDAAVIEAAGGRVVVVPGEPDNFKITTPADLARATRVGERRARNP